MESAAADNDENRGHVSSSSAHLGFDVSASKREQRWDSLLGINPAAWWASLRRTPQLLRERAFRTRTLADALEVGRPFGSIVAAWRAECQQAPLDARMSRAVW
jgi:hypothetical protein